MYSLLPAIDFKNPMACIQGSVKENGGREEVNPLWKESGTHGHNGWDKRPTFYRYNMWGRIGTPKVVFLVRNHGKP